MEQIRIDTGLKSFRVNGGACLCFNPADPNLYHRFLQAGEKITQIEEKLAKATQSAKSGKQVLEMLAQADRRTKRLLNETFGPPNDFDAALQGVNLLAVCENKERAVTNLLAALAPILEEGAKSFYEAAAEPFVNQAQTQRLARQQPEEKA